MADFVKMNGQAVRATGVYRRTAEQVEGPPLEEVELVIILRGSMANRQFQALLQQGEILLEIPDGPTFETTVAASTWSSSGGGEAAMFRHDLTLRETPSAAERRAAEQAATEQVASLEAEAAADDEPVEAVEDEDSDPTIPVDYSSVRIGGSASAWASALRQMTAPDQTAAATPPEEPLQPAELAGIEAVLVGLRLEALIDALDRAGTVYRSAVDDAFLKLIDERFEHEATPVVGEQAARRALKDLKTG